MLNLELPIPLMAASMAALICGPKAPITELTTLAVSDPLLSKMGSLLALMVVAKARIQSTFAIVQ